jgi:DNA-directed RNA polymerase specialized sigma24 family protein
MFDGRHPVRTKEVAERLSRNYGTVKTHLHLAGKQGLLKRMDRRGRLPIVFG